MNEFETVSTEQLHEMFSPQIEDVKRYFSDRPLSRVVEEMAPAHPYETTGGRERRAAILEPVYGEPDETRSLVLKAPNQKGWTPDFYIRARAEQIMVAPNSRMVVLMNNSFSQKDNVQYTAEDLEKMMSGDGTPIAEQDMAALETIGTTYYMLGNLGLSGYSQGGLDVMRMAALGSDKVEVATANGLEIPSKAFRDSKGLSGDFQASGKSFKDAVQTSGIDALKEEFNWSGRTVDMTKFIIAYFRKENKAIMETMTGHADNITNAAARQIGAENISAGYVDGSLLFDPNSLVTMADTIRIVKYGGPELEKLKHSAGDHPIWHGAMAADGFRST